jgi:hypothetical protein
MVKFSRNLLLAKHQKALRWEEQTKAIDTTAGFPYELGDYPWLDELYPKIFTPLSPPKFMRDYLGVKLYPRQEEDILALFGEDPKKTFDPAYCVSTDDRHHYQECMFLWGKGGGKGYVVSATAIWGVHVALCMKNPAMYLGQAFGEPIDIINVAYNQALARNVLLAKIKSRLKSCSWMLRALDVWIDRMGLGISANAYLSESKGFVNADSIHFPANLSMWALPATDAAEGKNTFMWAIDEICAWSSPLEIMQAKKIHGVLRSSALSRFSNVWRGFSISYPRHREDYGMTLYADAQRNPNGILLATKRFTWEVNERVTRESLQSDYDRDPEGSRCKYECDPPAAIDSYFRDPEKLILHASGGDFDFLRKQLPKASEDLLRAIADRGVNPIAETDQWGDPVLDIRGFPKLHRWFKGRKNRAGDDYEYYLHLDPGATGDSFGIVLGHLEDSPNGEYPMIDLAFRYHGRMFEDFGTIERWAWFDDDTKTTEQVTACEVDFRTVREFIYYLRFRGFTIANISQDAWNSVDNKQALAKRGFAVSTRIVSKEDYDAFKQLVYNRQLAYYAWPAMILEAMKLQLHNGTKVDAPRTAIGDDKIDSHKDVTDGIAAVCRKLLLLRDDATTFYQFPPIESLIDKIGRDDFSIVMSPDQISEAQQKIMAAFLDD